MEYKLNTATPVEIFALMQSVSFPDLRGPTPMDLAYAEKLHRLATNFELWKDGDLVGLLSAYMNDMIDRTVHPTLFCVKEEFRGHGAKLMRLLIRRSVKENFRRIYVKDVDPNNTRAVDLYLIFGGVITQRDGGMLAGELDLTKEILRGRER